MALGPGQPSRSPYKNIYRFSVFAVSFALLVLAYFWATERPAANSALPRNRSAFAPGGPSWNDLLGLSRSFVTTYTKPRNNLSPESNTTLRPQLRLPSGYVTSPDVTAIVLNWARLENVKLIVSLLCDPWLSDAVAETFQEAQCAPGKLRVHNSPENVFFQARFLACSEANTPLCFLQDDDYIILPEVIQALRTRALAKDDSAIYLLPPHEYLSSWLKTVVADKVHTSFAWLGHGVMVHKSLVNKFLATMHSLKPSDEVMKMADNYFSIVNNVVAETWFDHGIELGGGKPFTAGQEGDERNKRHIASACAYLDTLLDTGTVDLESVTWASAEDLLKAPCLWSSCLLETNIQVLPPRLHQGARHAKDMLLQEEYSLRNLTEQDTSHFYNHPLSFAVDGRPQTSFCGSQNATAGDFMQLDLLSSTTWPKGVVDLVWLIPSAGEPILEFSIFDVSVDGHEWVSVNSMVECEEVPMDLQSTKVNYRLNECSAVLTVEDRSIRFIRTTLGRNIDFPWCVHEMWLRDGVKPA
ncbi:hypothetical protein CONPUDRAFT_115881 [Coniophora puteana RWD-64-598 SS2]|uniref:Uncharacterized protein n=1 Tax=Coniophora puteana (strain RWD-64-598) TaxID=741705 RepID=A0A5M3N7X8_CONPW|nr:uncharacterized protein CONPUDRAFT_115881 [Coniophora puteana RWD-64-598 SS2]EIW86961.1 hypothetical protein CONPUDRAFT_115881 [Coniophora puteana RWD-64-598 SS2]